MDVRLDLRGGNGRSSSLEVPWIASREMSVDPFSVLSGEHLQRVTLVPLEAVNLEICVFSDQQMPSGQKGASVLICLFRLFFFTIGLA